MTLTSHVSIVVVAVLLSSPIPAFPQATESAPSSGGLFGGPDNRNGRHKLDFSFSLVEAYDSDTPPELFGIGPSETLLSGGSTLLKGHTEYHWQGSRVQVGATGESVLRHYSQVEEARTLSYSGGLGLSARLGGRTTLLANQSVAYSPSYLYGLFPSITADAPGAAIPAAPDYATNDFESYSYGTTVTLTQGLTRRSRLSATGEFQYTDFLRDTATRRDLSSQGIRAEFSRNLAPNTAVQVGYGFRTGTFGYGGGVATGVGVSATEHRVTVGLKHSRPLSATRRMIFDFNVGSSTVNPSRSADQRSDPGQLYLLAGDVAVAWRFSESWQARGAFRRGLEYVAELSAPVFADGFTAELSGLLNPRLDFLASARYSSGASALNRDALTFDTYGADFRVRYAMTRTLALYGEYLYYFYDFRGSTLALGIPPGLERNGVRAGLTVWIPALRR